MASLDFKKKIQSRVRVHYTDGTIKEFDVIDWEITLQDGRRLWKKHEQSINEFK